MPSDIRQIVAIRGTDEYRQALVDLAAKVGIASVNELAEWAIQVVAKHYEVTLPERTTGTRGGPRPGAGRKKIVE